MADTKLTALSALTTLTSDDLLYVVDDPSGTPASKKAALSALGTVLIPGLLGPDISVTGAVTATIGRMHVCTGTSANYTVTLPTAVGVTGRSLGFVFGPTATLLSKFVILSGNGGEKMNGTHERYFWAGEACVLESDGANWNVLSYHSNPMSCLMYLGSVQTLNNNTQTTILLDTVSADPTGQMGDTTNHRIKIWRTAKYSMFAIGAFSDSGGSAFTTAGVTNTFLVTNSSLTFGVTGYVTTSSYPIFEALGTVRLDLGDDAQLSLYQVTGATQGAYGAALLSSGPCILGLVENPEW